MNITKWISKLINRFRLIGKFRHLYRIRVARKVLIKLQEIAKQPNYEPRILGYLRKINPFVFEELILSVIEDSNIRITRNTRYTGDGGIDGIFHLKQGKVLIQCKRYKNYIDNKHVKELTEKVSQDKHYLGIFVHTGRTGDKSKEVAKTGKNIVFVSGSNLVNIILGKENIQTYINRKITIGEKRWKLKYI